MPLFFTIYRSSPDAFPPSSHRDEPWDRSFRCDVVSPSAVFHASNRLSPTLCIEFIRWVVNLLQLLWINCCISRIFVFSMRFGVWRCRIDFFATNGMLTIVSSCLLGWRQYGPWNLFTRLDFNDPFFIHGMQHLISIIQCTITVRQPTDLVSLRSAWSLDSDVAVISACQDSSHHPFGALDELFSSFFASGFDRNFEGGLFDFNRPLRRRVSARALL